MKRRAGVELIAIHSKFEAIRNVLGADPRFGYAIGFGSGARGSLHAHSAVDVALAWSGAYGSLRSSSERSRCGSNRPSEGRSTWSCWRTLHPGSPIASSGDGVTIVERDRAALVERKARAILEYLDFQPIEELFARGALGAAVHGR